MPGARRAVAARRRKPDGRGLEPTRKQHERALQKRLVQYFRLSYCHRQGVLFAVPNGEERNEIVAGILSGFSAKQRSAFAEEDMLMPGGQGVIPGPTDLVVLGPAAVGFVEVKIPRTEEHEAGYLGKYQKAFRAWCLKLGYRHYTVIDEDGFYDVLLDLGFKPRMGRPWGPGVKAGPQPRPRCPADGAAAPAGQTVPPPAPAKERAKSRPRAPLPAHQD